MDVSMTSHSCWHRWLMTIVRLRAYRTDQVQRGWPAVETKPQHKSLKMSLLGYQSFSHLYPAFLIWSRVPYRPHWKFHRRDVRRRSWQESRLVCDVPCSWLSCEGTTSLCRCRERNSPYQSLMERTASHSGDHGDLWPEETRRLWWDFGCFSRWIWEDPSLWFSWSQRTSPR